MRVRRITGSVPGRHFLLLADIMPSNFFKLHLQLILCDIIRFLRLLSMHDLPHWVSESAPIVGIWRTRWTCLVIGRSLAFIHADAGVLFVVWLIKSHAHLISCMILPILSFGHAVAAPVPILKLIPLNLQLAFLLITLLIHITHYFLISRLSQLLYITLGALDNLSGQLSTHDL